ncbi:hypothetical protein SDC9_205728 [bioreactor metagenome]|uniref:Uncharacterized protein n=1 Tax=bioreactor metagenome TaxID=1076179 RepID=A0A645J338_9ZZZZ
MIGGVIRDETVAHDGLQLRIGDFAGGMIGGRDIPLGRPPWQKIVITAVGGIVVIPRIAGKTAVAGTAGGR